MSHHPPSIFPSQGPDNLGVHIHQMTVKACPTLSPQPAQRPKMTPEVRERTITQTGQVDSRLELFFLVVLFENPRVCPHLCHTHPLPSPLDMTMPHTHTHTRL